MLMEGWPTLAAGGAAARSGWIGAKVEGDITDPFRIELPTLLIANKCDLDPDPEEVQVLEELLGVHYPAVTTLQRRGRDWDSSGSCSSVDSRSFVFTPRRRAEHLIRNGLSPCAAGRRCLMWPSECTKTLRRHLSSRASGVQASLKVNT